MREKQRCYELNCADEPLNRVGVNILKILGIQPGTVSFEKQKHLIAVNICTRHFLDRFPTYPSFKKAFFQGIIMISKAHYIKLAKSLYDVSIGKNVEGDFKALPRAWGRLRISRRGVSRKDIAAVLGCDNSVGGISCIALRPYN